MNSEWWQLKEGAAVRCIATQTKLHYAKGETRMTIAILGWGSLIWDERTGEEFDKWCKGAWTPAEGLRLPLEFSRISKTRGNALTLVIDQDHGTECPVKYKTSKRKELNDVICDLRRREGTVWKHIGYCTKDGQFSPHFCWDRIFEWVKMANFDAVVWTALQSNYLIEKKETFSVEGAHVHLKRLSSSGKREAAEYFRNAPMDIRTKLRDKVDAESPFD